MFQQVKLYAVRLSHKWTSRLTPTSSFFFQSSATLFK